MRTDPTVKALTDLMGSGVADGVAPGMACVVGNADGEWFAEAGRHTYEKDSDAVDERTLWDLASVTKIAGTTSVAMALWQDHQLDLDAHVQSVVAEFVGDGKEDVTVRDLLRHESGLAAYGDYEGHTKALEVLDVILRSTLRHKPGKVCEYSCLGFVTLGEFMRRLTHTRLDELVAKHVTGPLGMKDTFYKPAKADRPRCAPTEKYLPWRKKLEDLRGFQRVQSTFIQGSVHDPVAYLIGEVSGNAGLFSTTRDVAKIVRAWLRGDGPFSKEALALFTKKQGVGAYGLGFETKAPDVTSAGTRLSASSFGHTGYTGTTVWVDPESGVYAVLLTNRVCPTAANIKIRDYRTVFFDGAYELMAAR